MTLQILFALSTELRHSGSLPSARHGRRHLAGERERRHIPIMHCSFPPRLPPWQHNS